MNQSSLYKQLRITGIVQETRDVKTFRLEPVGERIDYMAGQYLTFVFQQHGQEIRRSYSIASSPVLNEPLAITFIYAQCPLPDYCIKMSKNFSDAALRIMEDPEAKGVYRLLSVSFDPARDTPEKLRSYGLGYLGKDAKPDFSVWQLAVGSDTEVRAIADFFGLRYEVDQNDKTQFNHSLRTAVISPEGKVTKILSGNEWTVNDLIREMKASAGS